MDKPIEKMSLDEFFKYLREQAKNDNDAFLLRKEQEKRVEKA